MRLEVHSAADFLMNLLRVKQAKTTLPENQLQHFKGSLQSLLAVRFRSHWYPDLPTKGSGFRCIRINGKMDPIVEQAGVAVGLLPRTLRKMLPTELTLWIDPEEVSYRIGENGSICVLYDSASRASPSSDVDSTGSGGGLSSGEEFIMERVGNKMPELTDMQLMDFLENKHVVMRTPVKAGAGEVQHRLNNSVGSDDSNSQSPPLSPRYQQQFRQRQPQQPHLLHMQQQHSSQQAHLYNGGRDNFVDTGYNMYQWDGFSNQHHHKKTRRSRSASVERNKRATNNDQREEDRHVQRWQPHGARPPKIVPRSKRRKTTYICFCAEHCMNV